jgi:peptidyl-prolyl cis-trans isomerase SurA
MKKLSAFLTVLFVVAINVTWLFGQEDDKRVLLTIAGDQVTVSDFMHVYKKNNLNNDQNNPNAMRDYLDLYINFRLKVKEAMDMGLDTVSSFTKELDGYRKQLAQPYFVDEEIVNKLLNEAYERKKTDIRASHILIKIDKNALPADTMTAYKKALEIRQRIANGEDFGTVAADLSEDQSARDSQASQYRPARKGNLGDLGYFTVFDMVYPFENAAYNTPVGQVSMPVRTDFGYHIIKVTDRQEALGQAQVAHIYISLASNANHQDSLLKKSRIDEAYQQLLSGVSFADVVKSYSEDKQSVNTGGKLPWFGANRMVPEFIIAVRNLKDTGEISKPFMTSFGWHIIKLLDRKKVGTFDEEKVALKSRLDKDARIKLSEESVLNRIKNEYSFKEYPKAKDAVLQVLDSTLLKGEWDPSRAAGLDKTLFTLGDQKYTQQDLAKYIAEKQNKRITDINTFFQDTYSKFVFEKCYAYEDSRLEEKYPEFRMLMQEYHDGILLFDLTDKKVWSKAVKDTTGLREFYNAHPGKYMWEKRVNATILTVKNPKNVNMEEVKALLGKNTPIDQILAQYNNDTITNLAVESGKYPKGDNEYVDQVKWKTGLSTPIIVGEGQVYVYIHDIVKPEPKTLDEARGLVTADYQTYLEQEWIKELKAKYPVKINEEVFATLK